MARSSIIAAFIFATCVLRYGDSSRILGIFPTRSISHQVVFRGLTLELNKRGHELVVLTSDPVRNSSLQNYTEIDTSYLYNQQLDANFISSRKEIDWIEFYSNILSRLNLVCDELLNISELKKLYEPNSGQKFDLILMELLFWPAFLPLVTRFDAPLIGVSSLGLSLQTQYSIGNPILSSSLANWELGKEVSKPLTFYQRLKNFISIWKFIYKYRTVYIPKQQKVARKHFGNDIPDLMDIEKNVSLIFVNQQTPISYVRPNVPGVIEIGGFHVSKKIQPLPKDLQKFFDEATQGFIYMSLGSNVKSVMLSDEAKLEFISAFAQLPYKVIWKFEDDNIPGKPDNVIIMKWTPQQAILAHPNLKVFIYQGGLQSTEEAIHHGVPLIGLPVVADQDMQVNKMVSLGVAKKLEISAVNRHELVEAIQSIVVDKSYKQRMLNLHSILEDRPYDPLDNAVWWTEYVIRHKGAPHLHFDVADDPWYRRYDLDITAFIVASSVIAFILVTQFAYRILFKCVYNGLIRANRRKTKTN